MWKDHDTAELNAAPPAFNTWITVFHDYDVRLLWCRVKQSNTETNVKNIHIRWTVDGHVYYDNIPLANNTWAWIYRNESPSTGGTDGLADNSGQYNATKWMDKCGQDFLVEVLIATALGTAQTLVCDCVYETLEAT
jgi:hypothetical protein